MRHLTCLTLAYLLTTGGGIVSHSRAADPISIAHRGLLRHAPENTLPAFAACLELGMGFELDIRTTKDGHLIVLHDDNVKRTTNGIPPSTASMTLTSTPNGSIVCVRTGTAWPAT